MFLPTTNEDLKQRAWNRLDVILVTGDAYIDSPHIGVAVIGRVLAGAGYRVGQNSANLLWSFIVVAI